MSNQGVGITLHSGLHKCASTFIQYHWWGAFGTAQENWYPAPEIKEPGHAEFAQALFKSSHEAADLVTAWVERAPHIQRLLISAEDCTLVTPRESGRTLREVLLGRGLDLDTHIIVMRPPRYRFPSMWAQLILAGYSGSQDALKDLVFESSCMTLGRLETYIEFIGCGKSSVFILGASKRDTIASETLDAVGLDDLGDSVRRVPAPGAQAENRVRSRLDLELIAAANQFTGSKGTSGEEVSVMLAALDASDGWRALRVKRPNSVDEAVRADVRALARAEAAWLADAQARRVLSLAGDVGLLSEWDDV